MSALPGNPSDAGPDARREPETPTTYDGWMEQAEEIAKRSQRVRCDDLEAQRRARVALAMAVRDAVESALDFA